MIRIGSRSVRLVFGLLLSALFVWILSHRLDFEQFQAALRSISLVSLLVALGLLAAAYAVRLIRWWWMLRAVAPRLTWARCAWPFFASFAMNNVLPFRAGDALRAFGFRDHLGVPVPHLTGALIVERLMDLMCVLAICFVGMLGVRIIEVSPSVAVTLQFLLVFTVGLGCSLMLFSPRLHALARSLAERLSIRRSRARVLVKRLAELFEAFELLGGARLSTQVLGLSILAWVLEGTVFVSVAWGLNAQPASLGPWLSLGLGNLATLVPSSPGGVGTFDYFAMLGLHAYGVDREIATAFAIIAHLIVWLPVTLAGLALWLMPRDGRMAYSERTED